MNARTPNLVSKAPHMGTTIFTVMSALATEKNAVTFTNEIFKTPLNKAFHPEFKRGVLKEAFFGGGKGTFTVAV